MKQESIAFDKKTTLDLKTSAERLTVAGTLATIVAAYALSICLFLFWKHPFSPFAHGIIFFLVGCLHVLTLRKGLPFITVAAEWIYTLVTTGVILVLLGSSSLWGPQVPMYLLVSAGCAFLLPFTLSEMWRTYLLLALDGAKVWYPAEETLSNYPAFYFNSTPMRFRVLLGNGRPAVTIRFKVSNEFPLGKIYYDLLQNKFRKDGKKIPLADSRQNLYHWVFFTTDGFVLTRALDPQKTLQENGLHPQNVIYVQRVSHKGLNKQNEDLT